MIMEVYATPYAIRQFKNSREKITVRSFRQTNDVKLLIDINEVNISASDDSMGTLVIQRYTTAYTGPK